MKLARSFAALLGLSLADYGFSSSTQEVELDEGLQVRFFSDIAKKIDSLKSGKEKALKALKEIFGEDLDESNVEGLAGDVKKRISMGEEHLKDVREDALKYAKLCEGGEKLNDALEKAITGASLEDAKKFRDEYKSRAEKLFPAKCPNCGSALSRGSASRENNDGDDSEQPNPNDYEF